MCSETDRCKCLIRKGMQGGFCHLCAAIPVQACGAKISYMVICKMEAMCCFVMFGGCSMVTGRRCVARNIGVGA